MFGSLVRQLIHCVLFTQVQQFLLHRFQTYVIAMQTDPCIRGSWPFVSYGKKKHWIWETFEIDKKNSNALHKQLNMIENERLYYNLCSFLEKIKNELSWLVLNDFQAAVVFLNEHNCKPGQTEFRKWMNFLRLRKQLCQSRVVRNAKHSILRSDRANTIIVFVTKNKLAWRNENNSRHESIKVMLQLIRECEKENVRDFAKCRNCSDKFWRSWSVTDYEFSCPKLEFLNKKKIFRDNCYNFKPMIHDTFSFVTDHICAINFRRVFYNFFLRMLHRKLRK